MLSQRCQAMDEESKALCGPAATLSTRLTLAQTAEGWQLERLCAPERDQRGRCPRRGLLLAGHRHTRYALVAKSEGRGILTVATGTTISIPSYNGTFWVKGTYRGPGGTPINVTQEVPLGATSLTVDNATSLTVGQSIMVRGKLTPAFLASVNNSQLELGRPDSWQPGIQYNQLFARNITAINGNTLSLDAPLYVRIGTSDMPGELLPLNSQSCVLAERTFDRVYAASQAAEVGFENLRGIAHYNGDWESDAHTTNFIAFTGTRDSWARNIVTEVYQTAVFHDYTSNDLTVQDSACLLPKARVWGDECLQQRRSTSLTFLHVTDMPSRYAAPECSTKGSTPSLPAIRSTLPAALPRVRMSIWTATPTSPTTALTRTTPTRLGRYGTTCKIAASS
jgi:hypothetical protein